MSCDPVALTELFFGELPADTAAALQRHAHKCDACTRVLQELREDRDRLAAPRSAPPAIDQLFRGIEQRLTQREAAPRRRIARVPAPRPAAWLRHLPSLLPVFAGGLALVLAFLVTGAHSHRAHPRHPSGLGQPSPELALSAADEDVSVAEAQLAACLVSVPAASNERAEACF